MNNLIIKKATEQHLKGINELSDRVFVLHDKLLPNFFADRKNRQ